MSATPEDTQYDISEIAELKQRLKEKEEEVKRLKGRLQCQGDYEESTISGYPKELRRVVVQDATDIHLMNNGGFAHQLLDAAPIQVYVKDLDRRYVYLNSKARTLLGANGSDPIGISDSELVSNPDELKRFRDEDNLVIRTCEKKSVEEDWTPKHPDEEGGFRKIRTTRFPIVTASNPNQAIGVVSICEDRTFFTRQKLLTEIVTLINHDWVNGVITALCMKLRAVLMAALKSTDEEVCNRARNLLSIGHDYRDDPSAVSKNDIKQLEEVTTEVIELAFQQFIPVHFMNAYLSHLAFYEMSAVSDGMSFRKETEAVCIHRQVLEYMSVFATCSGQLEFGESPQGQAMVIDHADDVKCIANVDVLRILVFQQLRNHQRHGDPRSPLAVSLHDEGDQFSLKFDSPGKPIEKEWCDKLGKTFGVRIPKTDDDGYPVDGGGVGFGLYYCASVAENSGGYSVITPYTNGNYFVYRMKKEL